MKKLNVILYIILILLLSSLVSASDLTIGLIHYYDFEQDPSTSDLIDQVELGGFVNSTTDSSTGLNNTGSLNGNAWEFEKGSSNNVQMPTMLDGWINLTINGWFWLESIDGTTQDMFLCFQSGGFNTGVLATLGASPRPRGTLAVGGGETSFDTLIDEKTHEWYMITLRYNQTHLGVWINGTFGGAAAASGNVENDGSCFFSRSPAAADGYLDGLIDEVGFWNISLTESQIAELWNDETGFFYPFTVAGKPATPTIQPPSPVDGSNNKTNVTLNVSHSTLANDVRYYLWFGDSSTLDDDDLYVNNATRTASEYKNFTTNVTDGTFFWKWGVQNVTDGIFSSNTTTRTLIIDTTNPVITLNDDNSFDSDSVSRINQYANFLYFNITTTDETGLFGFTVNITKDGVSFFNYSNTTFTGGNFTFNFTRNVSTSLWDPGVYTINISASDSHTALAIKDYDVSQFLGKITFDTSEGNEISISGDGAYSTGYTKRKDRYEFGFDYFTKRTERKFTIQSKSKIYYLPNSKYKGHFVILSKGIDGNWLDFEGIGDDLTVKKISDYEYEISFINLPSDNKIITKSLGGVNKVTETYKWYRGNYTTTFPSSSTFGNVETFSLNITRNLTYAKPNATFTFNGTLYTVNSTIDTNYVFFSRNIIISQPIGTSQSLPFFWNITINQSINNSEYSFKVSNTINVSESLIDNCSIYNTTILVIGGKDEETNVNVNLTLNILFTPSVTGTGLNNSYELSGSINYSFCSDSTSNFTLDSIMEYGTGVYTDRKYYLNNFSIDTSTISEVFLYHLNNSKASEITFTVFDTITGDKVSGAFIKILRFYPGENVFRVVEIERTDEIGETLGKMVLADVFYKFIIEKPAGTVKLSTDVLRILSLTRSFGISFVEDVLDTWDKIHGVSTSVTCTKGTQTCRLTWSDSSNIVRDATLEVWRTTGLADTLLSTQTTASAAGTISYTITEDTSGNAYTAKGFIESNTGTSLYGVGISSLIFSDNPFFTDETHRIAALFPLFLLIVVIIFALIDFGTIGIVIGSLLGLIVGAIIGILPIDPFYLISFILMAVILIYRLSK